MHTEFIQNIPKEYNHQSLRMKREHKSTKSNIDCKPLFYFYYTYVFHIKQCSLMATCLSRKFANPNQVSII